MFIDCSVLRIDQPIISIGVAVLVSGIILSNRVEARTFCVAQTDAVVGLHREAIKQSARKPPERNRIDRRQDRILSALNGEEGKPGMRIPEGTSQLVVVTSNGWNKDTAQLQIFERDAKRKAPWHAINGFSWPVNIGYNGMGWAAGGIIKTPEVVVDGQLERTGGPVEKADGSGNLDTSGHAAKEGDAKSSAGLFSIGLAWGSAPEPPYGSQISYKHIDPFYRVIPEGGVDVKDKQGRVLNGRIVREINPVDGKYECYDQQTGYFVEGSLSAEVMHSILKGARIPKYHHVIKDVKDNNGNELIGLLVRLNEAEIKEGNNGLPVFEKDKAVSYSSLKPETGKPGPGGTLDMSATKKVFRESDYRWSDHDDYGHAVIGRDSSGKPILSKQTDNLYNAPVRIVDRASGQYERLDPDSGSPVHLGFMEADKMRSLINKDEDMTHELYKWAIDIRQNVDQKKDCGSAIFIHDETKNIEQGHPSGTLGCTSMSEQRMKQLIKRLQRNSMILQVPIDELNTVVEALEPKQIK